MYKLTTFYFFGAHTRTRTIIYYIVIYTYI